MPTAASLPALPCWTRPSRREGGRVEGGDSVQWPGNPSPRQDLDRMYPTSTPTPLPKHIGPTSDPTSSPHSPALEQNDRYE